MSSLPPHDSPSVVQHGVNPDSLYPPHDSDSDFHAKRSPDRLSRSASSNSSLDPYYFGIGLNNESPVPPLPKTTPPFSTTPDSRLYPDPVTPVKNPADIDRRGLVGVGELATPRWGRMDSHRHELSINSAAHPDENDEEQVPDSPWTIEAVDGEGSDKGEQLEVSHLLRSKQSSNDESGGEEILYPRNHGATATDPAHPSQEATPNSPPSAYPDTQRRARKRTSDEFERDQQGSLLSKHALPSSGVSTEQAKGELANARKHKSLGSTSLSASFLRDKSKEKRRESLTNRASRPDRHARQTSTGSSSSGPAEAAHARRVHTTDYSHLPPSPSTSSIQQFLRQSTSHPTTNASAQSHSSANVAHSLLRGTQEGWSGLDDEATAEALRKLDGLGGKTSRARQSIGVSSRPVTPISKTGAIQWEGVTRRDDSDREGKVTGLGILVDGSAAAAAAATGEGPRKVPIASDEERSSSSLPDKTPKRTSARSSFTPKRASGSSTNYTGTPSSRDSMSAATSVTSVSLNSARSASTKSKRNSTGSDNLSLRSNSPVSTVPEGVEEDAVPPVPPLPKDLSSYRSLPSTATAVAFPTMPAAEHRGQDRLLERASVDAAVSLNSVSTDHLTTSAHTVEHAQTGSVSDTVPQVPKTPSKKWSFSGALNIKLSSGSPSTPSTKSGGFALSPKARTLRKSLSKDHSPSIASTKAPWSPTHSDAMTSAASLASLSSTGSFATSRSPALRVDKTPDLSHAENSSSSNGQYSSSKAGHSSKGPLSPSSSIRRGPSSKRLTPSSIPFFRRSSSQSMQIASGATASFSPPLASEMSSFSHALDSSSDHNPPSTSSIKATPSKKASVLSLGLPSLLKSSSSRRSLHSDSKEGKEMLKAKDADKARNDKSDKEKSKKEEKDRSESRISVLMGRKRGKTVSSSEPVKVKPPATLPPMQITALPNSTAQRVANLKSGTSSANTSVPSTPSSSRNSTSRLTNQTISSLQKQSDSSLRSRTILPTIAGSPSVAPPSKEPVAALTNSVVASSKDTPTKIPRISSRNNSPTLKNTAVAGSRLSMNLNGTVVVVGQQQQATSPTPDSSLNEFGIIDGPEDKPKKTVAGASTRLSTVRASPSSSTSRVPRQVSAPTSQPRKANRESMSFAGLRKSSTSSIVTPGQENQPSTSSHRFSALSPSKGLKLLSPKISLTSPRASASAVARPSQHSPDSGHQSLSTPSPVPVEDDETIGDKEMMSCIRRQQAKKLAAGASQEELDDLLRFPEPLPPGKPMSPAEVLQSSQAQHLSAYEKVEILDFPEVYCVGARSKKKMATPDDSHNNYGYDDDRGDYQVVNRDHLAYRYEVIDTLGKGSFGQVLHCRDHCTGESTAIKIIRNKKRFHHQALVEIKILDNLRKWDPDEKHHVIKMTEHFYFRNHLCIAMELLSINLYELIKANGFAGFSTNLIRRFTSQMLLSLSLMRHHRVVHCDLKPENVLLRHPAKSALKVIDFGSSCFEHEKIYTYIQSRFYRSPEVILGMNYHMAIDMWSLGCILAELYTGFPIFPGENEQEQLSCIMEVLGVPDKDYINRSSRKRLFFEPNGTPRTVVNSKGRRRRPGSKTLAQVLRCGDDEFVDFVAKCLTWDPERRMKPQAALRHPYIAGTKASKTVASTSKTTVSTSSLSGNRGKLVLETPKKSQISAPTPLTARSARTSNIAPTTPGSSNVTMSARTYRTQPVSYSSRTLNGLSSK